MAKYHTYTAEHRAFIIKHQADISREKLTEMINAEFGLNLPRIALVSYCRYHKLKSKYNGRFVKGGYKRTNSHQYTDAERIFIARHQAFISRAELVKRFNARFGTTVSRAQINNYCATHDLRRFNNVNPGSTVPIGTTHKCGKKRIEIKIAEDTWVPLHRHNYEKAHGAIPDGYTIRFLDGDTYNCDVSNLLAVPHAAQFTINRTKTYNTQCPELNRATMLTAALRTVTKRARHARHD